MVAQSTTRGGISTGLVRLLAVAVAVSVANLYYAQPLLDTLAADFGVSQGATGWVVTAAALARWSYDHLAGKGMDEVTLGLVACSGP